MKINNNKHKGFTLIEVMIVVAILGIIAAIAVPSYTQYVIRGKRTDAKVELLRIAQLQESFFVQNLSYASTLAQLGLTGVVQSEQQEYTMNLASLPAGCTGLPANACNRFVLTANAGAAQQRDAQCMNFTLSNTGAKGVSTATTATPAGVQTIRDCWK